MPLREFVASLSARRLITLLFVFSGITGLVYEVLWAKFLTNVLGSTAQAHTAVLATFLGGLALGNSWFGRRADRAKSGLELYGWLELAIGLSAAISPFLLSAIADGYASLSASFPEGSVVLAVLRFLAAAAVMLVPTFLMGGTLPALARYLTRSLREVESNVSLLYYLNSAGAVLGTLLAAFILVPTFGLHLTVSLTAITNALIGMLVLGYARARGAAGEEEIAATGGDSEEEAVAYRPGPLQLNVVYYGIFLSGVVSLVYETAWIRLLALVLGSSTYSFALMLAAFITGITLGSFLLHRGLFARANPYALFGIAELGVAVSIALTLPLYERLPYYFVKISGMFLRTESTFLLHESSKLLFSFLLMLPPTVFLGMTLPIASRLAARSASQVAWSVGSVFSANTVGNVLGAALGGLVLLPWLGIHGTIVAGLVFNLVLAAAILLTWSEASRARKAALLAPSAAAVLVMLALNPSWDPVILSSGAFRQRNVQVRGFEEFKRGYSSRKPLFHKEDSHCSVTVFEQGGVVSLTVNGKPDASSEGDLNTQTLSAHIPLLLHPNPRKVLVVGMGSGITAGSALLHPIERLDMVEISSAVAEGSKLFAPWNYAVHDNPRFKLHLEDAKTFLRRAPDEYDVIISEPSNPWIAGIGNLFSRQFYEESSAKLAENGLMVQWFHNYEMTDHVFRMILRTFAEAFPHISVWNPGPEDILLVGSRQPIAVSPERVRAKISEPAIAKDLERIALRGLPTFLSLHIASHERLREIAGEGQVNDDLFPVLEYEAPKAFFLGQRSSILSQLDGRTSGEAGKKLALAEYAGAKGLEALSAGELADLYEFHSRHNPAFASRILEAWLARDAGSEQPAWRKAQALLEVGHLEGAAGLLSKLVREHPEDPRYLDAWGDLAVRRSAEKESLLLQPDYSEAVRTFEKLLKLRPEEAAYVNFKIGRAHNLARRYAAALDHYEKAIRALDGKEGRFEVKKDALFVSAGMVALRLEQREKAAGYARRAIEINPANTQARELLETLAAKNPRLTAR